MEPSVKKRRREAAIEIHPQPLLEGAEDPPPAPPCMEGS
jgi:hypothetical protein